MSIFGKKKSTIGHKYYLGMHMVLCHGTLDSLNAIYVDGDKEIWSGKVTDNETISIDKPQILGGNSSEGGIVGDIDVLMGKSNQGANAYLQAKAGAVPNFRGVCSVVLKQMYLGNNAYLKRWSFRVTRTRTWDLWSPGLGAIGGKKDKTKPAAQGKIVIIHDVSYSMAEANKPAHALALINMFKGVISDLVDQGLDYEIHTYAVSDFGHCAPAYYRGGFYFPIQSSTGKQFSKVDYNTVASLAPYRFCSPVKEDQVVITDPLNGKAVLKSSYHPSFGELSEIDGEFVPVNYVGEPIYSIGGQVANDTVFYNSIHVYAPQDVYTSWSEIGVLYFHPDNPSAYPTKNASRKRMFDTYAGGRAWESRIVSPNILSSLLQLDEAGNKVVVYITDSFNDPHRSLDQPGFVRSSSMTGYNAESGHAEVVRLDANDSSQVPGDTFINGIVASAAEYRRNTSPTHDAIPGAQVTRSKRNLIKMMTVWATQTTEEKIFPWIDKLDRRLSAPYTDQGVNGTLPYNYFDETPVLDGSPQNYEKILENFKKMLRWEYDSPDPGGTGGGGTGDSYGSDMNPAHIVRECLTNPIWGMGYPTSEIDNTSFTNAALIFDEEELGLSIILDKESTVEEFIKEILRHVDAVLYIDRRTGLFCLKPVRDDYSLESLPVIDESNTIAISDYSKPTLGELTNSITVNAWDKETNTTLSVTVQNPALFMVQGREIGTKIQYPGITNRTNAIRVAQRDLRIYSTALVRCTIETTDVSEGMNVGSVFALSLADYDIEKLPMRVIGIDYGTDKSHAVRISCVQDVFSTPTTTIVKPSGPVWTNPTTILPSPITDGISIECPYYELCQQIGQVQVDANLAATPEIGMVLTAAIQPDNANAGVVYVTDKDYTSFDQVGTLSFAVVCGTMTELAIDAETVQVYIYDTDAAKIKTGEWAYMVREFISVIGLVRNSTNLWTLTIKRGCFDTQPVVHPVDSKIYFMDTNNFLYLNEYVLSEKVNLSVSARNTTGETTPSYNFNNYVAIDARAIRPYPPQDVTINNTYYNIDQLSTIEVKWAYRDRKMQTGGSILGFKDPSLLSPEPGTTYTLQLYDVNSDTICYEAAGLTGTSHTVPQNLIPFEYNSVQLIVKSVRDGFECYLPYVQDIKLTPPIGGMLKFKMDDLSAPPSGGNINFNLQ